MFVVGEVPRAFVGVATQRQSSRATAWSMAIDECRRGGK
jgi:hypothetical protein